MPMTVKKAENIDEDKIDPLSKFFGGPFNDFVFKYKYRILVIMSFVGCFALYFAVQISPLTKQETFFPDDTPILHTRAILQYEFTESSNSQNTLNVVFHWGIEDLDRSDVKAWDARSAGSLIWDEEFTITPPENQQALLDLCQELRETDRLVKNQMVTCWIEEMENFVTKVSEGTI
jgi:hypothetical protein